jgi:hypothetical protein
MRCCRAAGRLGISFYERIARSYNAALGDEADLAARQMPAIKLISSTENCERDCLRAGSKYFIGYFGYSVIHYGRVLAGLDQPHTQTTPAERELLARRSF